MRISKRIILGVLGTIGVALLLSVQLVKRTRVGVIKDRALGNFCWDVDLTLFFQSWEKGTPAYADIYFFEGPKSSNLFLRHLVTKQLTIGPSWLLRPTYNLLKKFNWLHRYVVSQYDSISGKFLPQGYIPTTTFWKTYGSSPGLSTLLSQNGDSFQHLMKILSPDTWAIRPVVGIHVRDPEFKKFQYQQMKRKGPRKTEPVYRNSNLLKFVDAARILQTQGYDVIRLGQRMRHFEDHEVSPILNYSQSTLVSDENDIHILRGLKFVICGFSGITELARWLRIPIFLVDFGEVNNLGLREEHVASTTIVLPKVFRSKSTNAILSQEEFKRLGIVGMNARDFRDLVQSPTCPFIIEENESCAISDTIQLGLRYLEGKATDREILDGQSSYKSFFGRPESSEAPLLSPYWPNVAS